MPIVLWGHPHYCTTTSPVQFSAPHYSSALSHPLSLSRQQNGPFGPSQTKELTGGGNFRKSQVDAPCQQFLRLTASPRSITDTLNLKREYPNANEFEVGPRALTGLPKTSAYVAKTNYGRDNLWLVGCLGSKHTLAPSQKLLCQAFRWSRRAWGGECGPCPDLSYNLAFALQLKKITENLSQGSRKAIGWSAPNAIRFVDLAIAGDGLDSPEGSCRTWLTLQTTGSTLCHCKYLPSCGTTWFSMSANFESKLAVRALVWSTNSGTPRSSCICLWHTYQGAQITRRRHLDYNTCSLRTWERTADLHGGHA